MHKFRRNLRAMQEATTKEDVGKRLRLMRERLNLGDQKGFAQMIGYEARRYGNWETGLAMLPIDAAVAICRIVPVDFDYLYRGEMSALPVKVSTLLQPPSPPSAAAPKGGRRHGS